MQGPDFGPAAKPCSRWASIKQQQVAQPVPECSIPISSWGRNFCRILICPGISAPLENIRAKKKYPRPRRKIRGHKGISAPNKNLLVSINCTHNQKVRNVITTYHNNPKRTPPHLSPIVFLPSCNSHSVP